MLKSVLAIVAGWVLTVALVILSTMILSMVFYGGLNPSITEGEIVSSSFLIANILTGFMAAMAGGYLTANLAPRSGLIHTVILATINLVVAIPMIITGAQPSQPEWYPMVMAFIGVVGTLDGGFIWRFMGGGRKLAYAV